MSGAAHSMLNVVKDPAPTEVGERVEDFLARLGGPAWIEVTGQDPSRTRALVTLLHGNEPSGVRALHAWLCSGRRPAVNVVCGLGSVAAAQHPPGFAYRMLPGHRDLNRCFRSPSQGLEEQIAAELLQRLRASRAEALIDLHNTSGSGPAYGVTTRDDARRTWLTGLFAEHLIITDLRIGALMEATEDDFPTITLECGGAKDPLSDEVALQGLQRYVERPHLFDSSTPAVEHLHRPVRVELKDDVRLTFAHEPLPGFDLVLDPALDRFNFGVVTPSDDLGWLGPRGLGVLRARDGSGRDLTHELFKLRERRLVPRRTLKPLMITTNERIARADCLFYVVVA